MPSHKIDAGGSDPIICVQARMGSTRLPGKSLRPIGGRPLLYWVLRAAARVQGPERVVLCTSEAAGNEALCEVAKELGVGVVRGSETDVLGRFTTAIDRYAASAIVRVCADNPFLSSGEIERLIRFFDDQQADYAFNHIPYGDNRYPDGLGAEIVRSAILKAIAERATDADREHVTVDILKNPARYRIAYLQAPPELARPRIKLDIDTPHDWERMEALMNYMQDRGLDPDRAIDTVRSYEELYPAPARAGEA